MSCFSYIGFRLLYKCRKFDCPIFLTFYQNEPVLGIVPYLVRVPERKRHFLPHFEGGSNVLYMFLYSLLMPILYSFLPIEQGTRFVPHDEELCRECQ